MCRPFLQDPRPSSPPSVRPAAGFFSEPAPFSSTVTYCYRGPVPAAERTPLPLLTPCKMPRVPEGWGEGPGGGEVGEGHRAARCPSSLVLPPGLVPKGFNKRTPARGLQRPAQSLVLGVRKAPPLVHPARQRARGAGPRLPPPASPRANARLADLSSSRKAPELSTARNAKGGHANKEDTKFLQAEAEDAYQYLVYILLVFSLPETSCFTNWSHSSFIRSFTHAFHYRSSLTHSLTHSPIPRALTKQRGRPPAPAYWK